MASRRHESFDRHERGARIDECAADERGQLLRGGEQSLRQCDEQRGDVECDRAAGGDGATAVTDERDGQCGDVHGGGNGFARAELSMEV